MGGRDGKGVGGLKMLEGEVFGGEFWCGRWRGGMVGGFLPSFLFSGFLWEELWGRYSSSSSQREGKGGGEGGEEGGEIREKGIQGWEKRKRDGGEKKGEMGMRELSL